MRIQHVPDGTFNSMVLYCRGQRDRDRSTCTVHAVHLVLSSRTHTPHPCAVCGTNHNGTPSHCQASGSIRKAVEEVRLLHPTPLVSSVCFEGDLVTCVYYCQIVPVQNLCRMCRIICMYFYCTTTVLLLYYYCVRPMSLLYQFFSR